MLYNIPGKNLEKNWSPFMTETRSTPTTRTWIPMLLVLGSVLFTLVLAEIMLRWLGFIPGYIGKFSNFKPVKQLVVEDSFITDSEGIFKANPQYAWGKRMGINADGFRSIPFTRTETVSPTILFLGDSFTWGASANPITNSFSDIIGRSGYVVYNTGIPGTGPNQYAALAEKYIPRLKPNIVAVMFYLGNDLKRPDPMRPNEVLYYASNAGWMSAYTPEGKHLTAEEAYQRYLEQSNHINIDPQDRSRRAGVGRLLAHSVTGTYLWWGFQEITRSEAAALPRNSEKPPANALGMCRKEFLRPYLERIRAASEANGARMVLFLIPRRPSESQDVQSYESNRCLLDEFDPVMPAAELLPEADYMPPPNDHFNNAGHAVYARFILETLAQLRR